MTDRKRKEVFHLILGDVEFKSLYQKFNTDIAIYFDTIIYYIDNSCLDSIKVVAELLNLQYKIKKL